MIVSVGLALVAACGGDEEDSGRNDGIRPDPPALAGPLVYERFGGLAGRASQIRLEPDGRATFATEGIGERAANVRPAELKEVERALARVDLEKLSSDFSDPDPNPDSFSHRVTYQGETVSAGDGSAPDEVSVLNSTLSALFDQYAPRRRG
jgi:hypothetical protein